jgi:hypothetical protein
MPIIEEAGLAQLARWQPLLRLADWDVDLRLVSTEWRKSGDIKVDLDDRKAVLLLKASMPAEDLEETLVHELVHLRLYALDQMLVQTRGNPGGGSPRRGPWRCWSPRPRT